MSIIFDFATGINIWHGVRLPALMEEKMAASAALLDRLVANEEFDTEPRAEGALYVYLLDRTDIQTYFSPKASVHR